MRIKAFTLIEIIVVIILLGLMFSMILNVYVSKKSSKLHLKIEDMPKYIKKVYPKINSTLYIYGKNCKKSILEADSRKFQTLPSLDLSKNYKFLKQNYTQQFVFFSFKRKRIKQRVENICLKLNFKKGRFYEKFILTSDKISYLFLPFYQTIQKFNTIEDAKKKYLNRNFYPMSADEYFDE